MDHHHQPPTGDPAACSTPPAPGKTQDSQGPVRRRETANQDDKPGTVEGTAAPAAARHGQAPLAALPAPGEDDDDGEEEGGSWTTLDVNGAPVRLDKLGPMVVHQDGTLSRIANWAEMTDSEKRTTLRVLGRRNQLRLDVLRKGDDEKAKNSR